MIDLPATPQTVLAKVIVPALALLPAQMDTPPARVLLVAFGAQETGYRTRQQQGGPAHGLWQCERPLMQLLLDNKASSAEVYALCKSRAVAPLASDMYWALLTDDLFAAGTARLALWCNLAPLPALGNVDAAFDYYIATWGPGAYTRGTPAERAAIRQRFNDNYSAALAAVSGSEA
ncbi:hypothetical protein [Rhodanobacter hydrolyticus]|uniref:Lysozyme n=1 Tax=Rhodanobacter hydrolyticus TaxID=2250595 RepID=A0ABW8J3P6_9GAMM